MFFWRAQKRARGAVIHTHASTRRVAARSLLASLFSSFVAVLVLASAVSANSSGTSSISGNGTGGLSPRSKPCDTWSLNGVSAGQSVTITMFKGTMSDPYMHVFNSSGVVVAQDDDSAGSYNSRVTVTWQSGYYVGASVYSTNNGTYSLTASAGSSWTKITSPCGAPPKSNQTISFTNPGTRTFNTSFSLSATATSGLAVRFVSNSTGICTVSGTNNSTATMVNAGTCSISAFQDGNTSWNAASSVTQSFTVAKADQTITFGTPANQTYSPTTTVAMSATSSSGLAVTFASQTTGVCTTGGTNGATVSMVASGTCTIRASQAGNTNFNAATLVDRSFTIAKASQVITFGTLTDRAYSRTTFTSSATTSASGLSVSFTSQTTGVCTTSGTNGSTITMVSTGTCTIRSSQAGDNRYLAALDVDRSFTVTKATQTISFSTSAVGTKTYGDATFTVSGTTTGTNSGGTALVVSFSSTTPATCSTGGTNGATITIIGAGTCSITGSQEGNDLFAEATPVSQSITINRKTLTAPSVAVASRTYNGTRTPGTLTIGSLSGYVGSETLNVTGSMTDFSSANVGTFTTTVTFTLADGGNGGRAANYQLAASSVNGSITVRPLTVTANNVSRTADSDSPTFSVVASGLVDGETVSSATYRFVGTGSTTYASTTTAPNAGLVGTYSVTPSALVLSGTAQASNYSITYVLGNYTITAGDAKKLNVPSFSGTRVSGAAFGTQPVVTVQDATGNTIISGVTSTGQVTAAITAGTNGVLVGTTTADAVDGIARFTNLGIAGLTTQTYTITYSLGELTVATQTVTPTPGAAAQLAVTNSPAAQVATAMSPQPIVEVLDAQGNRVTTSTARVTVAVGSGTLTGTTSVSAVNGVATFTNLILSGSIGTPYTFTFSSAGLTDVTQSVTLAAGPAAKLQLTTRAEGTRSGDNFTAAPAVTVQDAGGNPVLVAGNTVTATITTINTTGRLVVNGALPATTKTATTNANGIATFTNLGIAGLAGTTYTVTFSSTVGGTALTTVRQDITVTNGPAAQIVVDTAAASATSGAAMGTQPRVKIVDAGGNLVTSADDQVTITASSSGGTLTNVTATTSSGFATFSSLNLAGTAGSFTITYASGTLTSGTQSLTLTAGVPAKLSIARNAATPAAGKSFVTQPIVHILDARNNRVLTSSLVVTASLLNGDRSVIGNITATAVQGIATFSGLGVGGTIGNFDLEFSASNVLPVTHSTLTLTHGDPTKVVLVTDAAGASVGAAFTTQPKVEARDRYDNVTTSGVGGSTYVRMLVSTGASLVGSTIQLASNGDRTFSGVGISGITGTNYTLTFYATDVSGYSRGWTTATQNIVGGPGAATTIALTQPAVGTTAGATFTTQPSITFRDARSNIVTSSSASVTATISAGGTLLGTKTVNASSGVATFDGLGIRGTAGVTYMVTYSATGLSSVAQSIRVTPGEPSVLAITRQPATTAQAGAILATQPQLTIRDAEGNTVTNFTGTVTASLASGDGTLRGATTVTPINGIATFTDLNITGTAGSHSLSFAITGPITSTSNAISITPGAPSKVVVTNKSLVTAGSALSGAAFGMQPSVVVRDAWDNTITSDEGSTVTIVASASTGATLRTPTISVSSGVRTFSGLGVTARAGSYTITYSATLASGARLTADTHTVTVTHGAATALSLFTPAQGTASGATFTTQPTVRVLDSAGNVVADSLAIVTASVSAGGNTVGTTTATATSGVATFADLGIRGTSGTTYTVTYSSGSLSSITQSVRVTAGEASALTVTRQPSTTVLAGVALATQPQVTIVDAQGNNVTNFAGTVSASKGSGSGTLNGTTTVTPINGVATFTDLSFTGTAGAHTLSFAITGPITAASNSITVSPGAPSKVAVTNMADVASGNKASGATFGTQPVAVVRDAWDNTITTGEGSTVTITASASTGATLATPTISTASGVRTFSGVGVTARAGTYTITYAATLTNGTRLASDSHTVTVVYGTPASLSLATAAEGTASGAAFTTQPSLRVLDSAGNLVSNSIIAVTASITNGASGNTAGTATVNAVNGVATFTNLGISGTAGTEYTMSFASGALTAATQKITVTPGAASQVAKASTVTLGSAAQSAVALNPQPKIEVRDASNNLVSTYNGNVQASVSLQNGTSGGELVGVDVAPAVSGVATFSNLAVKGTAGQTYRVTFTAGSFTTTHDYVMSAGVAAQLSLDTTAAGARAGVAATTQPVVTIRDSANNIVTTNTATITASVSAGGTLTNATRAASSGTATFTGLALSGRTSTYTVVYSASDLGSVSQTVTLGAGDAARIVVDDAVKSIRAASGTVMDLGSGVRIVDSSGNTVSSATNQIRVSATTPSVSSVSSPACAPQNVTPVGETSKTILKFTSLTSCNWRVPIGVTAVDVLAVGGGGGGGSDGGGGGGGGVVVYHNGVGIATDTELSVRVGAGGNGTVWNSTAGSNGAATTIAWSATTRYTAGGGSLGEGWTTTSSASGGTASSAVSGAQTFSGAGGGRGVGGVCDAVAVTSGSAGVDGPSVASSSIRQISNAPVTANLGGGGGGGAAANASNLAAKNGPLGGAGGGGDGAYYRINKAGASITGFTAGYPGDANTGGGGGSGAACNGGDTNGTNQRTAGGKGADGVVYVAYSTSDADVSIKLNNSNTVGTNTLTVNAVAGVAPLSTFRVDGKVYNYTVTYAADGLVSDTQTIRVEAGNAGVLNVAVGASGARSGSAFVTQPEVTVNDSNGALIAGNTAPIRATVVRAPTGAATNPLTGTTTINAIDGVARFTATGITGPVGNYLVGVSSAGKITNSAATPLVHLDAGVSYSGTGTTWADLSGSGRNATLVGAPTYTEPSATVQGAFALSAASGKYATLPSGFANFASGLTIQATVDFGTAKFYQRIVDLGNGQGNNNIIFGRRDTSNELLFSFYNGSTNLGECRAVDAITSGYHSYAVTLSSTGVCKMYKNGAELTTSGTNSFGTVPQNVTRNTNFIGESHWSADYGIDGIRNLLIYDSVVSAAQIEANTLVNDYFAVTIAAGEATKLSLVDDTAVSTIASGAKSGKLLTTQPVVRLRDSADNLASLSTGEVTASIVDGAGCDLMADATLSGTTAKVAVAGVVTFTDLALSGATGTYCLNFASSGGITAATQTIELTAGDPVALSLTAEVSGTAVAIAAVGTDSGATFTTQPKVAMVDAFGNLVDDDSASVSMSLQTVNVNGVATGTLVGGTANSKTATASNGVATFSDTGISGVAGRTYRITYSATVGGVALTPVTQLITVTHGVASQLVVTTEAADMTAGATVLGVQPVVEIRDAAGNVVTNNASVVTAAATTAVAGASGTLSTNTATASSGVATFSGMTFGGTATDAGTLYTITYTAGALSASHTVSATPGTAVALSYTRTSGSEAAGAEFVNEPVIRVVDASNNVISSASTLVSASVSGGATLIGQTDESAVGGVATFTTLGIRGTVGTYTLTFSATLNGTSRSITGSVPVVAGAAVEMILDGATGTAAGAEFDPQPSLTFQDVAGNVASMSAGTYVKAEIATVLIDGVATGSFLDASTSATANVSSGVARFTGLGILGKSGQRYVITYTAYDSSNVVVATLPVRSQSILVTTGVASQLVVTTEAADMTAGVTVLGVQPVVEIRDAAGNVVDDDTTVVTAAATTAVAGASGSLTVNNASASNGVASFSGMKFGGTATDAGTLYTITYTAGLLSDSHTVSATPGPAVGLSYTRTTGNEAAGEAFTNKPTIKVVDSSNNVIVSQSALVTASVSDSATLVGQSDETMTNGSATFSTLGIRGTVGTYTLTFSATLNGSATTVTGSVPVIGGPVSLVTLQSAVGTAAGATFNTQPSVSFIDVVGNGATMPANSYVKATIATIDISGTTTGAFKTSSGTDTSVDEVIVNGIATFSGLGIIGTAGQTYEVTYTAYDEDDNVIDGLPIRSQSITVTAGAPSTMSITTAPGNAKSGTDFGAQPRIELLDAGANRAASGSVTVTVTSAPVGQVAGVALGGTATINANAGVVTFTDLRLTGLVGDYILTFTPSNSVAAQTSTVTLGAGAVVGMNIRQPAVAGVTGTAFTTQPIVAIVDAQGNAVETVSAQVSAVLVAGANGRLVGTTSEPASAGVVTFGNLGIAGRTLVDYDIEFRATVGEASFAVIQDDIKVLAGDAAALELSAGTTGVVDGSTVVAQSGVALSSPVIVNVVDAGGNTVANSSATVTASVSSGAFLGGTTEVTASSGVATFNNLTVNGVNGITYSLTFEVSGLPVSTKSIKVATGPAYSLVNVYYVEGASAGAVVATAPSVQLVDTGNNVVATGGTTVTASISAGATVSGASVTTNDSGIALFEDLIVGGTMGTEYTLTFASTGLLSTTQSVVSELGAASQLAFITQGSSTVESGAALSTQPVIVVQDAAGNTVANSTVRVSATVSSGGVLVGTSSLNAIGGLAQFTNLGLSGTNGTAYTFTFASPGLTSATFTVTPTVGAPTQLINTTSSVEAQSGQPFSNDIVVQVRDSGNNLVTSSNALVSATISAGATLVGDTTVEAVGGIVTFATLGVSGTAGDQPVITFSSAGMTVASIQPTIDPGPAAKLSIQGYGSGTQVAQSGAAFALDPVLRIEDSGGNLINTATTVITATITQISVGGVATGELVGTTTVNADGGIVTFGNLGITGIAARTYTVTFAGGGLAIASEQFTVTTGPATRVVLTRSSQGTASGAAFTTQPMLTVQDTGGNTVTQAGTVRATVATGSLVGTTSAVLSSGVATFANLGLTGTAGQAYTVTYSAHDSEGVIVGSIAAATQSTTVSVGEPARLALTTPASGAASGSAFTTQPVITVQDSGGNTVTASTATIEASVATVVVGGVTTGALSGGTSAIAVDGVASFSALTLSGRTTGAYTITYTAAALPDGSKTVTQTVTPTSGTATSLRIVTSASGAPSGAAFTTQPVVEVLDAAGNRATTSTARVIVTTSGGSLVGNTTVDATSGLVTFTGLGLTGTAGTTYTLSFGSAGVTVATQSVEVEVGAPTMVDLTTTSTGTAAGANFTRQPSLSLRDSGGNLVATGVGSSLVVTATVAQVDVGGELTGVLVGSRTATATGGVATFTNLGLGGRAGVAYTVSYGASFNDIALTSATQDITPTPGTPIDVGIQVAAQGAVVGEAFTTQPRVIVLDDYGNTVTAGSSLVTVTVSSGATLIGTTTRSTTDGVAAFTNIGLRGTSGVSYTLSYALSGNDPTTQSITLFAGAASRLAVSRAADGAAAGSAFTVAPQVQIKDASGNLVTTSTAQVTATITQVNATGVLVGTSTVAAVGGTATFADLGINGRVGTAYTITYSALGVSSVNESVTVDFGAPATLEFVDQSVGTAVGAIFTQQPRLVLKDLGGNVLTGATTPVVASIAPVTGTASGALAGTSSITPVNGIAAFTNLRFTGTAGTAYRITYTAGALTTSQVVTASLGSAASLELTRPSVGRTAGARFTTQPQITLRDAGGNTVTSSSAAVTATISTEGRLLGGTSRSAINGVATFTDLGIDGTPTQTYTVTYSSPGLTAVTQDIAVVPALDGLVPTLDVPVSTADGFRVNITNFDNAYSFTGVATQGGRVTISSTGVVTVAGLAPYTLVAVTISSTQVGYTTESVTVSARAAIGPSLTPTFGTPTATATGFTVQITNFNSAYVWRGTTTGGTVTINSSGLLTVSGVAGGSTVNATVTTTRAGYDSASATSASVTTLLAGRAPTFTGVTRTTGGFTAQISNYDAAWTWSATVTSGGTVSVSGTGLLTVSGLPAGTTASALVATSRVGYSPASGAVESQSLSPALEPSLAQPTATASAWSIPITNYDAAYSWSVTTTQGTASVTSTGAVTVSGITSVATLTVTTSRTGYLSGSASTSVAVTGGLTPLFGSATASGAGFTVQVTNHDAAYSWSVTSTSGTATISPTGLVTVASSSATVTVTSRRSGYSTESASYTYGAADGLTPTFGSPVSTTSGFTVTINNYDASYTWTFSATAGATATFDALSRTVTVSGLERGVYATVNASTNKVGYSTANASIEGRATPLDARTPTVGSASSTADGYTVQITNFDREWIWTVAATGSADAEVDQAGLVTVSGIEPGTSAILTLTSIRERYADGTVTVLGSALSGGGLLALFEPHAATAVGFTAQVRNFDSAYEWAVSASSGSAAISETGRITVTGLAANSTSTVTVTTSRAGRADGTVTFTGGSLQSDGLTPTLLTGRRPTFSGSTRTADGFTLQITNFDAAFSWSASTSRGSTVNVSTTGLVTVSGLAAATNDTVVVKTSREGYANGSDAATGMSLATGTRASNVLSGFAMRAICPNGSPDLEGVANVNDLVAASRYSCYTNASRAIAPYAANTIGFFSPDVGNFVVNGIAFTAAPDSPERDPLTYTLWGCAAANQFCTVLTSNDVTGLTTGGSAIARGTDGVRSVRNSRAFNYYKVVFGAVRGETNIVSVGEVRLLGESGLPDGLTPTFGSASATPYGYTVEVSNFSSLYQWTVSVTEPGIAAIDNAGFITVSNLSPATESTVTVTTRREGFAEETGSLTVTTSNGVALVPIVSSVTSTTDGLTAVIENYDPEQYTWSTAVTSPGVASVSRNGVITVTGIDPGTELQMTVTTSRPSYLSGSTVVDARTLRSSDGGELSIASNSDDGFIVQIDEYDELVDEEWEFSVSVSQGVNFEFDQLTGLITVSNLGPGSSATVTVIRERDDSETVTESITGSTNPATLVPEFATPERVDDTFSVQITNFSDRWTWSATTSVGDTPTISETGLITVTGLAASDSPTVRVTAVRTGYTTGTATVSISSTPGRVPTLGTPTATTGGFTVQITNFDAAWIWTASVAPSGSATVNVSSGVVTVTDIAAGVESVVTVRSTRATYADASETASYTAGALAGLTPTFATPLAITGGYTVQITNFDPLYSWSATSSGSATTAISSSGVLTVTNVPSNSAESITLRTTRTGYTSGVATVSGAARLLNGRVPTFGQPTPTADGYTVQITNFDGLWNWSLSADNDAPTTISSSGLITVSGVAGFTMVSTTVTSTRAGYNPGVATVRATSTAGAALVPLLSISLSTNDGYQVQIRNYDPRWTWTVVPTSAGVTAAVDPNGLMVVRGVVAGTQETVTVQAVRTGFITGESQFTAVARQQFTTDLSPSDVVSYARAGSVATLTTALAHGLLAGDQVVVSGVGDGFDGIQTLATASGTTFTFASAGATIVTTSITPNGSVQPANDISINVVLSPDDFDRVVQAVVNIPYSASSDGSSFVVIPAMTEEIGAGYRVVRIDGTTADGQEIENLDSVVRILFDPPAIGAIPVQSTDNGLTWRALPLLSSPELPAGQRDGYYINSDGTIWIFTRHLSMFGVLAEQAIPLNIASTVNNLNPGDTAQLTVTGGEGEGQVVVESLTQSVCTLDANLVVTSITSGTCTVRATKGTSGRFLEAVTSLSLTVAGQSIPSSESSVTDTVIEKPIVEKPVIETPVVETPVIETPVVDTPVKTNPTKPSSNTGSSTESTTDATDIGLKERIDEAEELAKTPFTPGIDSPVVNDKRVAVITENGEILNVTITVVPGSNGLTITGDGFSVELKVVDKDGNPISVDNAKRLVMQEGATLALRASGFAPNSIVTLWLYSQPYSLGEFVADENGDVEFEVTVPAGIELGEHTVQLNGVSAEGELRTMNIAVVVTDQNAGSDLPWLPITLAALSALLTLVLVMRKTRLNAPQP